MVNAADVSLALNGVVIVCLVIVLGLLFHNTNQAQKAAKEAAQTRELAQEFRVSSDDLTRFIRTYAVTGNVSYWNYFQEVIKIRNGNSPLPIQPWRVWWDLYIADGTEPRGRGPASSINGRFEAAGFTRQELDQLEEARRQSDALVDVEDVASNAMQGRYRIGEPGDPSLTSAQRTNFNITAPANQTYAMELTHNFFYHFWKGNTMRPLDEFAALSSSRVDNNLSKINNLNTALLSVLGASIGILVVIMLLYIFKLRKDSETSSLLNSVLPPHVSSAIQPSDVTQLRDHAGALARAIRRQAAGKKPTSAEEKKMIDGIDGAPGFPVLYHEHLPIAWISFADVVGFTRLSRVISCGNLISILNELFAMMDAAATRFRVVKLKCIGDAFMSCKIPALRNGGKSKTDLKNVARCGFDMLRFLFHSFELAHNVMLPLEDIIAADNASGASGESGGDGTPPLPRDLDLRAGINAGPCASGVVGFDKFQYDVFGDTVNTAARMEASGKPNAVHLSKEALSLIIDDFKDNIDLVEGDEGNRIVELKGIGPVETCLVSCVRAPHGETNTDHRTGVTFAEIHSRGDSRSTSITSNTVTANSSSVRRVTVKTAADNSEQQLH